MPLLPSMPHHSRQLAWAAATGALALSLGGCNLAPVQELIRQGHAATVECLQGERAITDGNELRCEEWAYVQDNYLRGRKR